MNPQATPLNLLRSSYVQDNFNNYQFEDSGAYTQLSAGGPTFFVSPVFEPQPVATSFTPINIHNPSTGATTITTSSPFFKMDYNTNITYDKSFEDDMTRAEIESMKFEPEVIGPLVGEKKSCHAITEEYARGDPIFVAKTVALPQTYSHYRPIRGDGNCGWRAIACGYFETLLQGDSSSIRAEIDRLTALNTLLTQAGFSMWVFEDMIEGTFDLLRTLAEDVERGVRDISVIIDKLNDQPISDGIVYHLRLLASATLKMYPADYTPFIPNALGVEEYCKSTLEPSYCEIEHLGMSLLVDVLFKPIPMAVEIGYLDRSEGTQINVHRFGGDAATGVPTIHLLYRPGHYDLLYKIPDTATRAKNILENSLRHTDIQVRRASSFTNQYECTASNPLTLNGFAGIDLSILTQIPGFSMPSMNTSHNGFPSIYPITSTLSNPSFPAMSPISPHPMAYTNPSPTTTLPLHPGPAMDTQNLIGVGLGGTNPGFEPKFRMSSHQFEAEQANWQDSVPAFQTSTFKNSHYNTAHYNNPNFHPEQWSPDSDEGGSGGGGRMRHHST